MPDVKCPQFLGFYARDEPDRDGVVAVGSFFSGRRLDRQLLSVERFSRT
jgi:hypothetical protein